ncbi:hypothetical protein TruAng_006051 [Truncatella angustata]|nr:hypothetical protein TruAng_006051 [Truncatella angustata]
MVQEAVDDVASGIRKIDFNHPYTPYDVQQQFMKAVYDILEQGDGQIGILESPTGTGKSLSLICAALTWLRHHKKSIFEASVEDTARAFKDEPDWIIEQMLKRKREQVVQQWEEREARLKRIRTKERSLEARGSKRRRVDDSNSKHNPSNDKDDTEWLLIDREDPGMQQDGEAQSFSKETRTLMEKLGMGQLKQDGDEEDRIEEPLKIYYTSRTHSQLTQFINELRRPKFPPSVPEDLLSGENQSEGETIKHIPLSSRQRLCINPSVSRLGSLAAINDRCKDLQQSKSDSKCHFVPNANNISQTHQFRDSALASLPDIEDLFDLGKKLAVCPYYASRTALPEAEIITLPYPLLLQQTAREALGIDLKGSVVIVDEAHNIMDAVANVYASEISLSDLKRGRQMLGGSVPVSGTKRREKLTPESLQNDHGIVDPNALLQTKAIDQINLYKLIQYIQESKLAYKIEGYAAHVEEQTAQTAGVVSSTPVLHDLVSFLVSLTNLGSEGRIFFQKDMSSPRPDIKLSYLLLSPTHAFSSVASSARAVILAGGTMSPFEDYTAHLFPDLPLDKITTLSCGHVIPASNLCVWTLAAPRPGPLDFEFSFQKRSDKTMVRELGIAILNMCSVVPDGMVVFFPSYGYLDEVVATWSEMSSTTGSVKQESIWARLQAKKALFRESKGGSSDEVLAKYSEAILGDPSKPNSNGNGTGALLLSVIGGKMSEGINFSDRLGRCVIIVGLPYPNINSPDWKARIEYIESTTINRLLAGDPARNKTEAAATAKQTSRDFYESACMRAVNQSIGRAIRHKGDYAAIVLVDRRFGTERIRRKLPGWIQGGMVDGSEKGGLGQLMGKLGSFFRSKKS